MSLDWSILQWIESALVCPALDFLMPKITALGNGGAVWLLASGGLICTKKYRKQGIVLLGGLAVGVLVGNVLLKNLIARPQPCWLDSSIQLLIADPTDYSSPLGIACRFPALVRIPSGAVVFNACKFCFRRIDKPHQVIYNSNYT